MEPFLNLQYMWPSPDSQIVLLSCITINLHILEDNDIRSLDATSKQDS